MFSPPRGSRDEGPDPDPGALLPAARVSGPHLRAPPYALIGGDDDETVRQGPGRSAEADDAVADQDDTAYLLDRPNHAAKTGAGQLVVKQACGEDGNGVWRVTIRPDVSMEGR